MTVALSVRAVAVGAFLPVLVGVLFLVRRERSRRFNRARLADLIDSTPGDPHLFERGEAGAERAPCRAVPRPHPVRTVYTLAPSTRQAFGR